MQLAPVKQKTKELKRIQAEDAWKLTIWYEKLKNVVKKDTPSRLIYNFDECGFQPGRGKTQKVIGGVNPPDLPEFEHSETITALECIAADGWQMDPMFIFKSATFQESWFHGSEALPSKTLIAISSSGWISDELILQWLNYFHKATNGCDRTKKGEKRVLIFDGHSAHFSAEFLQKCQDYNIICVAFEPHSTHLCQPLDGKPFLSYKQHFRVVNNELAYYAGQPAGKAEFLRVITPVRERAFNSRIIRESFSVFGGRSLLPWNQLSIKTPLLLNHTHSYCKPAARGHLVVRFRADRTSGQGILHLPPGYVSSPSSSASPGVDLGLLEGASQSDTPTSC